MKHTVRVLRRAQADLTEIRDYVRRDRPAAADRLMTKLVDAIGSLEHMPDRGSVPRDETLRGRGYRVLIVGEHPIFYKALRTRVRVYRVVHGRSRYRYLI